MDVFFSWSGDISRELGQLLAGFLKTAIPLIEPFFSLEEASKRARWQSDIALRLEKTPIAILILTHDNLEAPWMMFEAGALSKNIGKSCIFTLLFDLQSSDIIGPLEQFNHTPFSKTKVYKLALEINGQLDSPVAEYTLIESLDSLWNELEKSVRMVLEKSKALKTENQRPSQDQHELLEAVRQIRDDLERLKKTERAQRLQQAFLDIDTLNLDFFKAVWPEIVSGFRDMFGVVSIYFDDSEPVLYSEAELTVQLKYPYWMHARESDYKKFATFVTAYTRTATNSKTEIKFTGSY